MRAPVRACPDCDRGELLELMRVRAPEILEGPGDRVIVFKCSTCGAISSSSSGDAGQIELGEEVTI